MKRHLLIAAAAALILPACDAVRLPGINPAGADSDTVAEPWVDAPSPPVAESEGDVASDETPDTLPETAPAVEDTASPEEVSSPEEAADDMDPAPDPEAETGEDDLLLDPQATPAPLPSLASLNARICSTGSVAAQTPTVARVAGATTIETPAFETATVNGLAASLASFPGIVKVEPKLTQDNGVVESGHCGATRIAGNWFVTAAHCVDEPFDAIQLIGAVEDLRNPAAHVASASLAICHAGYDGIANGYGNDIALIRLSEAEAAALGEEVPVAAYGTTALPLAPANYALGEMAGWGLTRYGGQLSNTLQTTMLAIESAGPALIYAASRNGAGPCIGDSGGPLYITEADGTKTVVGLLSVVEQNRETGEYCAGQYTGRYTNLQGYKDWIEAVMARCDAGTDTCN